MVGHLGKKMIYITVASGSDHSNLSIEQLFGSVAALSDQSF